MPSKARPQRPPRAEMLTIIRAVDGNIARIAAVLGVSRPTVYAWLDQLDLSDVVGVHSQLGISSKPRLDDLYSKESQQPDARESTEKFVKLEDVGTATIRAVNLVVAQQDLRMQRSVLVADSRWNWAKHRSIDTKKTVSEIVEEALDLLRARAEQPADAESAPAAPGAPKRSRKSRTDDKEQK